MPFANQKNSNKKIALIAGRGELPKIMFEQLGKPFVVSFESDLNEFVQADFVTNMGQISSVLAKIKEQGIEQVVFAGGIVRPKIRDLKLDKEASKLLATIAKNKLFGKKLPGDDALFQTIIKFLEKNGLQIIGVDEVASDLLIEAGALTNRKPNEEELLSISTAVAEAKKLGERDKGQAVVVVEGKVVATEDERGTDAMLADLGECKGAVLLKCKKPQQDRRIDLPSIGVATIERLSSQGFAGVAIEAQSSIIIDKNKVLSRANELEVFVFGF